MIQKIICIVICTGGLLHFRLCLHLCGSKSYYLFHTSRSFVLVGKLVLGDSVAADKLSSMTSRGIIFSASFFFYSFSTRFKLVII